MTELIKIGELCDISSSKRIFAKEYKELGVPFFRGKEITEKYNGKLNVSTELFITEEKFLELESKFGVPQQGDMLLTSVGTLGSTYIVKSNDRFYFKDGNLTWFKNFKGLNSQYLQYWLESPDGIGELRKSEIGSSQSAYTIANLKEMKIELPSSEIQLSIVDFIKQYDSLIENNNRRIAILEDMAQSLYREWFVNFRYPGHADAVDKDGNQKLIDSPLGQIPEGWEVDELKPFCSKIGSGATPRGGKGAYQKEGVPLIRSMNIYDSTLITKNLAFIDDVQAARLKNVVVEPDDVLLNITGASVARCSIVPSAFTPARVNQHVAIIRLETNQLSAEYLMYTLISANGKARLLSTAQGGATREALTKTDIEKFKIVIPPPNIIKKFNALVKNTVKQKEILFLKNENLKKQRDMLLPKLISGQIEL
jgi:type I restriction enzyme S subunit